jgi:hypothetical protein
MERRLKFEKDDDHRWYAVLPEWEGSRDELEMVCGADTWLEILSQGEDHVWMTIADEPFENANHIELHGTGIYSGVEVGSGASYMLRDYIGIPYELEMWLCDVTLFVFGKFPEKIYYS